MKIQIDFTQRSIKIEGAYKLRDIVDTLDKVLKGEWKDFTLESNTVIHNWSSPIVIKEYIKEPFYQGPQWLCNAGTSGSNNVQYCSAGAGSFGDISSPIANIEA